ncbi:MAG: hypothetical protein Q9208_004701 [Pyrenodesmia sp. 3 TL-2023]
MPGPKQKDRKEKASERYRQATPVEASSPISPPSNEKLGKVPGETPLESLCYGPDKLPGIPKFPSFAARRVWALSHMAAVFRHWSRMSFHDGLNGHISVRDPEYHHLFWTNPLGIHFGLLKASDFLLISDDPIIEDQQILGGNARNRPANKAGWAIHGAIHRRRPDVHAVCHAHTTYGKVWSASGRKLEMINQDVCKFYGDALALYDNYGGVALGPATNEGNAIAKALGAKAKAAVLVNHGLLTVGKTVDEAGALFTTLEKSCQIQVEAEKAGCKSRVIGDEEAAFNFRMESVPETLYWEFQPTYDYEVAASHNNFQDVDEAKMHLDFLE